MLSKSQIGFIKSLHQKKYRKENGIFIIEGIKSIIEFIPSAYQVNSIYYLAEFNPQGILALVNIPDHLPFEVSGLKNSFSLVLDGIQDPGNLGTIIRTADWFGFKNIICSQNTVEVYNPKTVQATMGSLCRVNVFYEQLPSWLPLVKVPVFGALLEGKSSFELEWGKEGVLILGNEGQGISPEVLKFISHPVTIPRIGKAESLNVAISAVAEWLGRGLQNLLQRFESALDLQIYYKLKTQRLRPWQLPD
eukprot:gene14000-16503_t